MRALHRFEASYIPEPNSGCWIWVGTMHSSSPYGKIKVDGRTIKAHRYSWELANGPIPDGSWFYIIATIRPV
jgi:hypothetical protein